MSDNMSDMAGAHIAGPKASVMGSVNAGFAFFLDCIVNLFILAAILLGVYGFPKDIVLTRIIPGGALGIFLGNVMMFYYAQSLARKEGGARITSIPIGLDIATTFAMAYIILGPIFEANKVGLGEREAAELAWRTGMAVTLWVGVGKLVFSGFGGVIQRLLPDSAVLGTLSGIALMWLGAEALLGVFEFPEIGMLSMAIMIYALMAGHRLPFQMPGALAAVVIGTAAYFIIAGAGISDQYPLPEISALALTIPGFSLGGLTESFSGGASYFGIVLPLALLAAISGVNVVRSAAVVKDHYDTPRVMQIDAIATIASAFAGGAVQTISYLGHATYKRMGAQTGYSLYAGLSIVALSTVGAIGVAATVIPNAVLKGILVVVAGDIVRISLQAVKPGYGPSFLFAMIPAVYSLAYAKLEQLYFQASAAVDSLGGKLTSSLTPEFMASFAMMGALSRGYILTSLLWASMVAWVIDGKYRHAAIASLVCAGFSLFGVMHSVKGSSEMYLPWAQADPLPWRLAGAYLIVALVFAALPRLSGVKAGLAHGAQDGQA